MGKTLPLQVEKFANTVGLKSTLVSREYANKMFHLALGEMTDLKAGTTINCSFEGISYCDYSFVDQFLLNLQLQVLKCDNVLMYLTACAEDVLENIKAALALRNEKIKDEQRLDIERLNLLLYQENCYTIVGHVENGLEQAFNYVQENSAGVTARMLADALGIESGSSAANRLKKLYDARLLCRDESIDETGRQFLYFIPEK